MKFMADMTKLKIVPRFYRLLGLFFPRVGRCSPENRRIVVVGRVRNHQSFYQSVAMHEGICESAFLYFPEAFNFQDAVNFWLGVRRQYVTIYVEEFVSSLGLASLLTVLAINKKISLFYCVHNANKIVFGEVGGGALWRRLRKKVARRSKALVAVSDNVAAFLNAALDKPVVVLPFQIARPIAKVPDAKVNFSVPGSVDGSRRDYALLFRSILQLCDKREIFQVYLLGEYSHAKLDAESRRLIQEIQAAAPGVLQFCQNYLSDEEFEAILAKTDALIGNLRQFHVSQNGIEIYGVTKETGIRVIADSRRIPCLLTDYVPPGVIRSLYRHFHDDRDLARLMRNVMDQKTENLDVAQCSDPFSC